MIESASATEVGRLLGITSRRVHQLAADGTLPKPTARGAFPLADSVKAFVAYVSGREEAPRTRLGRLRADLLELELRRKSGELVDAESVRLAQFAKARRVRDALESMRVRLAAQLAAETDVRRVDALLAVAVREILR